MTSHDEQMERYAEQYTEPDPDAPKSTGYANQPSVTELLTKVVELRNGQVAEIKSALAGNTDY